MPGRTMPESLRPKASVMHMPNEMRPRRRPSNVRPSSGRSDQLSSARILVRRAHSRRRSQTSSAHMWHHAIARLSFDLPSTASSPNAPVSVPDASVSVRSVRPFSCDATVRPFSPAETVRPSSRAVPAHSAERRASAASRASGSLRRIVSVRALPATRTPPAPSGFLGMRTRWMRQRKKRSSAASTTHRCVEAERSRMFVLSLRPTTSNRSPSATDWTNLPRWVRASAGRIQSTTAIATAAPIVTAPTTRSRRHDSRSLATSRTRRPSAGTKERTPPKSAPMEGRASIAPIARPMRRTAPPAANLPHLRSHTPRKASPMSAPDARRAYASLPMP